MVEVMKIMETSFKSSHTQILPHSVPLTLQQATANPCLCQRLLDIHGQSGSVSCEITVPFSLVLMHTGFVCALQESVSPVPCKFWDSMVGLMVTSSKKAFAIPRSAAPEPLPPWLATADAYLCRRHSNTVLAQSLLGLWVLVHIKSLQFNV